MCLSSILALLTEDAEMSSVVGVGGRVRRGISGGNLMGKYVTRSAQEEEETTGGFLEFNLTLFTIRPSHRHRPPLDSL